MEKAFECFDLEQAIEQIAEALGVGRKQVRAAVELLDAGNTIPFIARYRKEATQGLDEIALRGVEDGLSKARELAQRKTTILKTIDQQGALTPELRAQIEACTDKQTLEDIYLPYKPKRRTRATIARERGLQPLADLLLRHQPLRRSRSDVLRPFVQPDKEVPDEAAALQGACD
ncbi:MAG TPA: Tex-like N-terminal domain-containing protein, partial [Pirellulales bacterium]|nr:Tex-like N-terminal domain-containing protein [Pirellulales bacterium]